MPEAADARRVELAANLERVRARVAAGSVAAGRDPATVTLVAITKTYPASDVVLLSELGVRDIGENRDQEAVGKAAEVAEAGAGVRWHFVGQLQRNKCRSVVGYADMVHSVDSQRLVAALADAAARHRERPLDVLVQVSLDGDPERGGALFDPGDPDRELDRVIAAVAATDSLVPRGLMTVAPAGWEPERAFAVLAELAGRIRIRYPTARALSAGMSGDLEAALVYGATHVRIGSALLGNRAPLG